MPIDSGSAAQCLTFPEGYLGFGHWPHLWLVIAYSMPQTVLRMAVALMVTFVLSVVR